MSEIVLSLQNAQLALDGNAGRVEILHGISLEVKRGETLGLVGPSGSGKSSLLMLMGGLERVTGGHVSALGARPAIRPFPRPPHGAPGPGSQVVAGLARRHEAATEVGHHVLHVVLPSEALR